jgi:hypothetical protein
MRSEFNMTYAEKLMKWVEEIYGEWLKKIAPPLSA